MELTLPVQYKLYEFKLHDCLVKTEKLLTVASDQYQVKQWIKKISSLLQSLEQRKFRVAIVGEFNRGKTSFVNALLGREVLPADYIPTTASINRITYNDTPNAYIIMRDGKRISIEISELANYVTKLSKESAEQAALIDEAVVEYPSFFCRNGVDLIDTPGMNDETPMNQITISKLEDIDIAIITIDASMPFSMTECSFTAQLLESKQVCQIIIVITKIDLVEAEERQKIQDFIVNKVRKDVREYLTKNNMSEMLLNKYHEIFDNPIVFSVSSTDALHALKINDLELFKASGFAKLNDELPTIILRNQNSNIILNTIQRLLEILNDYKFMFSNKIITNKQRVSIIMNLKELYNKFLSDPLREVIDFSPKFVEDMQNSIRKKFIEALSNLREFRYDRLQETFAPIIKLQFHEVNKLLRTKELNSFFRYVNEREKIYLEEVGETQVFIKNFLPSSLCKSQFNEMFAVENGEKFYWVASLIPDEKTLHLSDWNVMPHVNQVIDASLKNYIFRRTREFNSFFTTIKKYLMKQLTEIPKDFAKTQFESLNENHLEELNNLEAQLAEINQNFLAELNTEQLSKRISNIKRKDRVYEKVYELQ